MMLTLILLMANLAAFADEKPICSHEVITDKCKLFADNKDKPVIELRSGGEILNPFYKAPTEEKKDETKKIMAYGDYQKTMEQQGEALEILEKTPISGKNKLVILSMIPHSMGDESRYPIHWPLNKSDAQSFQNKSRKEILTETRKIIGDKKFNNLKRLLQDADSKVLANQQALLAEQILVAEERQEKENLEAGAKYKIEKRLKELEKLFEYAQNTILQTIRKGRRDSELSDEERILVKRVESVKIGDPFSTEAKNNPQCQNGLNGFLDGNINIFYICPNTIHLPSKALIGLIGHEIGHSIDPCRCTHSTWKVDQAKLDKFSQTSEEKKAVVEYLKSKKNLYLNPGNIIHSEEVVEELIKDDVLTEETKGVSLDRYPFKNELSCLEINLGFPSISIEDEKARKAILSDKDFKEKALYDMPDDLANKSVARLIKDMEKHPTCYGAFTHESQTNEAVADIFGGLVQEKYISENPFKDEDEKRASYWLVGKLCSKAYNPEIKSFVPQVTDNTIKESLSAMHASTAKRIDKIFLNLPAMEEIYNCKRNQPNCFDHLSLVRKDKSIKSSPTGATK